MILSIGDTIEFAKWWAYGLARGTVARPPDEDGFLEVDVEGSKTSYWVHRDRIIRKVNSP
jgi:hypothetical protein